MEGVSHPVFRSLIAEQGGVGMVCTEFVRISRAPIQEGQLRAAVIKHEGVPLSVQVMGNDADKMADAAEHVSAAGADVVDINLGCPMPRAVRGGVGAAMLKDLALLSRVLRAMRARTPVLLSAKIRAGFDDAEQVVTIARTVEDAGVDFITVHPRRRCDFYDGVADWRIIGTLKEALRIPVVGNGDVWYAEDAARMRRETGADAVMIGRPAMRNPWIFRQVAELAAGRTPAPPDGDQVVAFLHGVRARYESAFGERRALGRMKELLRYMGRALPDGPQVLRAILREGDLPRVMGRTEEAFSGRAADALDLGPDGSLGLERSGSAASPVLRAAS